MHSIDQQAKSQEEIRSLRLQVSTTLSETASLSSTLSQTELQLSRQASDFELQLSALTQQIQASDEDAQLAREKGDRWKAEVESLRRRVGELGEEAEGRKRRGEENESAQELREELKRQSISIHRISFISSRLTLRVTEGTCFVLSAPTGQSSLLSSQAGQLTSLTAELTTLRSKRSDQSNRVSTLELEVEQWSTRCRELEEASSAGDKQGSKEQERVVSELKSRLEDKSRKIDQLEKGAFSELHFTSLYLIETDDQMDGS
jgi:predicted RNase H-like nuclease (RuvC/YqgF family)